MTWAVAVNGTDLLAGYGFYLMSSDGLFDAPTRTTTPVLIRGRAGTLRTTPVREEGRTITLRGGLTTSAKTVAAYRLAEDVLKDALRAGLLRITRTDGNGVVRLIEGYGRAVSLNAANHPLNVTDAGTAITFDCVESAWRDPEPQIVSVAATATRYNLVTGTAPASPIIRMMAATNPVLTYRDAGGTARATMTFTWTGAAGDYVDIDMRLPRIVKYVSGTASNGRSLLASGTYPWAIDPQDGDYATSSWPTIEISNGSAVVYHWRAWQ